MKRALLFILLLLIVGGGIWYFFIRPKTDSTGAPTPGVFQSFFPIDTNNADTTGLTGVIPDTMPGADGNTPAARFTQITERPVAGYSIFSLTNTLTLPNPDPTLQPIKTTVVDHFLRYVARASGYVYEIKNTQAASQVSNIFIPNVYEAVFADNNATAVLRFLRPDNSTIATYSVPIPPMNDDGTRTQKAGIYLPDNTLSLAVSPDSKSVARLTVDANGALISTTTAQNTAKKDLIRSTFREWLLSWPVQNAVYVQTKAAATANGFLYRVDSSEGRLRKVVGDVKGLTTLISPSGTYVLYSESNQSGFSTKLFNTKTGTTTPLSLALLPEKCTWYVNENLVCAGSNSVPAAVYPDAWYAGLTHFQDQLYHIDTTNNTYSVLYDGNDRVFDMVNLTLDEGQDILYFIDKTTGMLWKFTL